MMVLVSSPEKDPYLIVDPELRIGHRDSSAMSYFAHRFPASGHTGLTSKIFSKCYDFICAIFPVLDPLFPFSVSHKFKIELNSSLLHEVSLTLPKRVGFLLALCLPFTAIPILPLGTELFGGCYGLNCVLKFIYSLTPRTSEHE